MIVPRNSLTNKLSAAASLVLFALSNESQSQIIPAFPGAEGYGAYALGGRNGDVYHVTNLNASGPGSFAEGISTVPSAGRTIVFDVSGYIRLPSGSEGTRLTSSKVTIAGQTAPGDGIGFYNNFFRISGDDIVLRHLRFRHGKYGSGGDCVDLDSGCLSAILDHVSLQFSTDENMSSFGSPPENITLQYSLNAWGLETHSCGGLWDQNHATSHHNLWAHNHTRNPKARPSGLLEWVNNVTFDWDIGFIMGDSTSVQNWKANVINNYFLCPPGNIRSRALVGASLATNGLPNFTVHLSGNLSDNDGDGILDGFDKGYSIVEGTSYAQSATAFAGSPAGVTTDNALTAYKKIVSNSGALRLDVSASGPLRDEVDTILISKLTSQTRFHVTRESDTGASAGGFGTLNSAAAPVDTDKDGMPDFFETALGWNAAADDHKTVLPSSGGIITPGTTFFPANTPAGYTRLEEYLHFKAVPHGTVPKNIVGSPSSLVIDLKKFTSGFSSSPSFTVANVIGGSVAQSGTGNSIATFTPALNHTGRARFEFTVMDSQGSTWTQTCAIVVANNALPRDLVWSGDGTANAWDTTATNWRRNGVPTSFSGGDFTTFDDSGSKSPATTVGAAGAVTGGIVVNAAGNYTFSGTGGLSGPLTKRGAGTLVINNAGTNALTPAALEEGTLSLPSGAGLGAGTLNITGGTLSVGISPSTAINLEGNATIATSGSPTFTGAISGAGTLNLALSGGVNTTTLAGSIASFGGTIALGASWGSLRFNSSSTAITGSAAATFDLGSGNLTLLNRNGNLTINLGALSGGPNTRLHGAGSSANPTTYSIGGNGADSTFQGSIANNTGTTAITKVGNGTLTLTGANTYTGATNVNSGWLLVGGSLGNSAVNVAPGAALGGSGTLAGSLTANSGSFISPGTLPFTGAILTANGGLNLNGPTLYFDMSNTPAGANDRIQMNGGTLAFSGSQYFQFLLLQGQLAAGTYDLITGAAGFTGTPAFTHNLPTGTRQTFNLGMSGSTVRLTVTGDPATLTWTGATNGNWDTATVGNWAAPSTTFYPLDAVIFDDTATGTNVTPNPSVTPRSTLVSSASKWFTIAGGLDGGSLTKSGASTLTLTGTNLLNGGVFLNGGTIQLGNDTANNGGLGSGPVTFNGGTLKMFENDNSYNDSTWNLVVPAGQTGTLWQDSRSTISGSLSGGGAFTLRVPWIRNDWFADCAAFTGAMTVIADGSGGDFRFGTSYSWSGLPNASLFLNGPVSAYYIGTSSAGAGTTIPIGEISGTANSRLMGGVTGGRNFVYVIGGRTPLGSEAVFAGTIAEQNATVTTSIVKTGAGMWTLSGNCTWNGGTIVQQGTLRISGAVNSAAATKVENGATLSLAGGTLSTDTLTIADNATLSGYGTVQGDLTNLGTVTCGTGALTITGHIVNDGTMRITSGATLNAGSDFINNGVLDLLTSGSGLPANFVNNGVIISNSERRVLSAAKAGNNFTCTVQGYPGHVYQLQRADSLAGTWGNVGSAQAGNGGILTFTDIGGATGTQRFYKILVTP